MLATLALACLLAADTRDLADGKPVDASGEGWYVAERTKETTWVYRMMKVRGHVRAEDGTDISGIVRLRAHVSLEETGPSASSGVWVDRPKLPGWSGLPAPDKDGKFEAEIPRIKGMTIYAHADGWMSTAVPAAAKVVLVLDARPQVAGVLVKPDGQPLANVEVRSFVILRGPGNSLDADGLQALAPRGGYAMVGGVDEMFASFQDAVRTGANGNFRFELGIPGELVLVAYPPGHRPVHVDRMPPRAKRQELRLVARPGARARRVVFSHGPQILANKTIQLVDLSLGAAQVMFSVKLDAQGGIASPWLVEGHYYSVWLRGQRNVNMAWPMAGAINLATPPQKFPPALDGTMWTGRWKKKK